MQLTANSMSSVAALPYYCRGQLLPASSLTNRADVDFIQEGVKYETIVTKASPDSYHVALNDSAVVVETHKLSDGGLLISYDGKSIFIS